MTMTYNPTTDKAEALSRSNFSRDPYNDILTAKVARFMKFLRAHKSEATAVVSGAAIVPLSFVMCSYGASFNDYSVDVLGVVSFADVFTFLYALQCTRDKYAKK